jgi:hypothetical protein
MSNLPRISVHDVPFDFVSDDGLTGEQRYTKYLSELTAKREEIGVSLAPAIAGDGATYGAIKLTREEAVMMARMKNGQKGLPADSAGPPDGMDARQKMIFNMRHANGGKTLGGGR